MILRRLTSLSVFSISFNKRKRLKQEKAAVIMEARESLILKKKNKTAKRNL